MITPQLTAIVVRPPIEFIKRRSGNSKVYVSVDENAWIGNPNSDYHVLCATSVKDAAGFENPVSDCNGFGFRKGVAHRRRVLEDIDPIIGRIYYIVVRKSKDRYSEGEMRRIHQCALRHLANMVMNVEEHDHVDVEISHEGLVPDDDAESYFISAGHSSGISVDANVVDANESPGLRANSFVTGAISMEHSRLDDSYSSILDSSMYGFFTTTDDIAKWIGSTSVPDRRHQK